MESKGSGPSRIHQPVLPLLPAQARPIGPSAGLLQGPDGGVVFVFGLATFHYGASDEVGRRLAAVQLVASNVATSIEVASAFEVNTTTLWRWARDFTAGGVAALAPGHCGPKGPSKLTAAVAAAIVGLDASGMSLLKIAARTGVSTATVRVALGRVTPAVTAPANPASSDDDGDTAANDPDAGVLQDTRDLEQVAAAARDLADLEVLAAPVPRTTERAAARSGALVEAPVVITQGAQLPLAGLLLALPALEMTGLLDVAAGVFPPMRKGFYGLRAVLLMLVFMALLRQPRAEDATRIRPADLGRVLGLDRAPEVKTLRRKLAELTAHGRGAQLQAALALHHATTRPGAVGFLYLDGHVRVYTGTRKLPKTHIARMRIAGPATEETWVGDADGDPVMVLTAAPSQSLAAELHRLLPDLRTIIGPDRACTVVFDRGGYSPEVFTEIITAGFDVLTYFKGTWAHSAPAQFGAVDFTAPDGATCTYDLAERPIVLPVPAQHATSNTAAVPASTLTLRLIVRRSPNGHQSPILTNRTDLTAAQVAYRMGTRWRQENYFKYARQHFALDALDSYADQSDDLDRLVPNPAKARAKALVAASRGDVETAEAGVCAAIEDAGIRARTPGSGGKAFVDSAAANVLSGAEDDLASAKAASRAIPTHLPLQQVRPGSRLLETERKLLTHAIRMSAYNTESALARLIRPHYARGEDEARALIREAFTLPGDLQIIDRTLHVRLDPATAPRRSQAIAALCAELTDTKTRYPGTDLTIAYSVKDHPATA